VSPRSPAGAPEAALIDGRPGGEVSALERGLHYGDGLFETIACVGGVPRLLPLHLKRLTHGCRRLALRAPDLAALEGEIASLARGGERAVLKLIVTRGTAQARGYAASGEERGTRLLLRYPWPKEDARLTSEGVRVRFGELRLGENPALAGLKTLNRLEQVLARFEWSTPAIAESLLFSSSGDLVSGTASNVFLVRAGALATPRLDRCGVAGVMREAVGLAARRARIALAKCALARADLETADEIFLTNALIGVRPVRELAGRTLAVGPVTRRLQEELAPLLRGEARLPLSESA
jgi:4-amino-4-deoxychorismate lyase